MTAVLALHAPRQIRSWQDGRWGWKRSVRDDPGLTDAANLLAAALSDDFANRVTGLRNPPVKALAGALGKSERSIQRAIRALAGWRLRSRSAGWQQTDRQ